MKRTPRVLVVATSRKTRGGITSVIKAHEAGQQWKQFHCHWVQTHRDGSRLQKILYLIGGVLDFTIRVSFYDIVHFHTSQPVSALRKLPLFRIAKFIGKKTIMHFHAFDVESTICATQYKARYRTLFAQSDKVLVLSNWWRNQLISHLDIPSHKIITIYNPCPRVVDSQISYQYNIILYAGTINERKGYTDLIRAFATLENNILSEWRLVFAGNGEIEKGQKCAAEMGIADRVEFLGWVAGEEKDAIFKKASIFCLPSYAEGFPMAVLDAWAYGLPVITTPVGGIPDVAKDGENMLLFNAGDVDHLALQLKRLMLDDTLRNQIAQQSRTLATTTFNLQRITSQLADIYEGIGVRATQD